MKNLSLKVKLYSLAGVLILFVAVIGVTGYWSSKTIGEEYSKIANINYPNSITLFEEFAHLRGMRIQLLNLLLPGNDEESIQKAMKKMEDHRQKAAVFDKSYLEIPFMPGEEALYQDFKSIREKLDTLYDRELELFKKNRSETSAERQEMIKLAAGEIDELSDQQRNALRVLLDFHKDDGKKNIVLAEKAHKQGIYLIISLVLGAIVFGGIFAIFLSASLIKTFTGLGASLANSGDQVSSAATQIASASDELAQATTEQAASLQQTSSSIDEISSMISANTENAKQSSVMSEQSLTTAERGKVVVGHMIKAIGDINSSNTGIMNQINETNKEIESIVKIIHEIGAKTKVINDIVFQTKLLSFNASVEAARAGDQGRGFAVVAEEVGNLATMSGQAALEITNMLDGSIKTVENIVRESKDKIGKLILNCNEKVETGTRVAVECEGALNEIVSSVAGVSKMINEISTASLEQAKGVHEITKAIAQLDQVTQQNSASSAESANAAGALSNQAETLNNLVQELVQTIQGGKEGAAKEVHANSNILVMHKRKNPVARQMRNSNSVKVQKEITRTELPSNEDSRFVEV